MGGARNILHGGVRSRPRAFHSGVLLAVRLPGAPRLHLLLLVARGARGRAHRTGQTQDGHARFVQHRRAFRSWHVDVLRHHRRRCAGYGRSVCQIGHHPLHRHLHCVAADRFGVHDAVGHHFTRDGFRAKPGGQIQHDRIRRDLHATPQHVPLRHRLCRRFH